MKYLPIVIVSLFGIGAIGYMCHYSGFPSGRIGQMVVGVNGRGNGNFEVITSIYYHGARVKAFYTWDTLSRFDGIPIEQVPEEKAYQYKKAVKWLGIYRRIQ